MTQNKIQTLQIPPVSREFALELQRVFRPLSIKPGVTSEQIMFNAGELKVVEFVMKHSVDRIVSGNPNELKENKDTTASESWLRRALRGKL